MGNSKHKKSQPPIKFSPQFKRFGVALFEQQMWCWGCDVRHRQGNLLMAYGFQKRASPNPHFHSAYTYWIKPECSLTLWGWGLWIAAQDCGSLFISRNSFRFRYLAAVDLLPCAWQERDLPDDASIKQLDSQTSALDLMTAALNRIIDYECWLNTQVELDYRKSVISAWPQRKRYCVDLPTADLSHQWIEFTHKLSQERFTQ